MLKMSKVSIAPPPPPPPQIVFKFVPADCLKLFKAAYIKKFETKSIGHRLSPLFKNNWG